MNGMGHGCGLSIGGRSAAVPRPRRSALAALGVSVLLHAVVLLLGVATPPAEPPAAQRCVKRFTKRLPRSRRPLVRRQAPQQLARPLARAPGLRSAPLVATAPAPLTTRRRLAQGTAIPLVHGSPPPPHVPVQPLLSMPAPAIGPRPRTGALHGERASVQEVDLGVELLDVAAMDTGRRHALVVIDPRNPKALSGYLYLTSVFSENLERAEIGNPRRREDVIPGALPSRQLAERETLRGLAEHMSERTGVRTKIRDSMRLDDPALMQAPFVLLTVGNTFDFSPSEAANLGRCLTAGGFLYAEVARARLGLDNARWSDQRSVLYDLPALRELIRAAFRLNGYREGSDWAFERLPQDHPLYHCYYDLPSLPRGFRDVTYNYHLGKVPFVSPDYLEGIRFGNELVGLYSQRNFSDFWAGQVERQREQYRREYGTAPRSSLLTAGCELPVYDLGVNILVYALTREGSLAQKLVAAE